MNPNRRYMPDPILLNLTWALTPPLPADSRADIVRLAMARFAHFRGQWRLSSLFYSMHIDALKGLLLAFSDSPVGDDLADLETLVYRRSLKEAAPLWRNPTFVRLASVAADLLDWDAPAHVGPATDSWTRYVLPAWRVLTDELEYESEAQEFGNEEWRFLEEKLTYQERNDNRDCSQYSREDHGAYSRNKAKRLAESDRRTWSPWAASEHPKQHKSRK